MANSIKNLFCKYVFMSVAVLCLTLMFGIDSHATGEGNPRIMVENFSVSDDEIVPGEDFELRLRMRNTSQYYDTYNVIVTVNNYEQKIAPVYGESDQIYIDKVYARNSWDITFRLHASEEIKQKTVPLSVVVTYNDNYFSVAQSNTATIYLPTKVKGDLNVTNCLAPEKAVKGTKARVKAEYENIGLEKLSNLSMHVKDIAGNEMTGVELYTLLGGEKGSAEAYLDCTEVGEKSIAVCFTYEDENGDFFETMSYDFDIEVTEGQSSGVGNASMIITGGVTCLTFILLAAIVMVLLMIIINLKNRTRK